MEAVCGELGLDGVDGVGVEEETHELASGGEAMGGGPVYGEG